MKRHDYPYLPEEMVLEIFSWLPAKFVGRFRCLSKSWRSLLSQPQFIRTHLERSRILNHKSFILSCPMGSLHSASLSEAHHASDDEIKFYGTEIYFHDLPYYLNTIRASCHGLLFIGDYRGKTWVMNPITWEIREVLPLPFENTYNVSRQSYGLGYDSRSHDYEIVMIYADDRDPPFCSEMFTCVYSLKCGSWRSIGNVPHSCVVDEDSGVFMSGHLHWCGKRSRDNKPIIITFDLSEEKFGELPLPKSCVYVNKLGVLGGCLSVYDALEKNVWVMKEYSVAKSWTKFVVDVNSPCHCSCFLGEEQAVIRKEDKNFIYDLRRRTSIDIVCNDNSQRFNIEGSIVESLVSPWLS